MSYAETYYLEYQGVTLAYRISVTLSDSSCISVDFLIHKYGSNIDFIMLQGGYNTPSPVIRF